MVKAKKTYEEILGPLLDSNWTTLSDQQRATLISHHRSLLMSDKSGFELFSQRKVLDTDHDKRGSGVVLHVPDPESAERLARARAIEDQVMTTLASEEPWAARLRKAVTAKWADRRRDSDKGANEIV